MTPTRLLISSCQRVRKRYGSDGFRFCGDRAVAVYRYPDGRELFVCGACDHDMAAETKPGESWGTHRRAQSALVS